MADITNQKKGSGVTAGGKDHPRTVRGVVDIAAAVADGLTAGDNVELMDLNAGDILLAVDAKITEALVLGASNSIDIGTTEADPDEYVDNQSDTAVGVFTAYVAGSLGPSRVTADATIYCEINGAAVTSGKIGWSVTYIPSSDDGLEMSDHRSYTN